MAEQQANGVATEQQGVQFAIQRIFVKDISFEAPNAPAIFRKEWKPEVIPAVRNLMTTPSRLCCL